MLIKLKSFFKKRLRKLLGKPPHLKNGIKCNFEWFGNSYGGFYVCPELLNEKSVIYSFGIGEDMSFDRAVSDRFACRIFCFDPTPKSIKWYRKQKRNLQFSFYEYGISDKNESVDFYLPKNPEHVSGSVVIQENVDTKNRVNVAMKSLSHIMKELDHRHIDVLKMDIEGAEYKVIDDILKNNLPITQILIEFHDRFFEDGLNRTKRAINLLKENGYEIFAVSQSLEEVSFIKKNFVNQ